jgi:UDP-N-acetylglucosamine transferase subunit ALG13
MIFVTVGNEQKYKFTRLLREVDEIAPTLPDDVVMQVGIDSFQPRNCRYFAFVPHDEYLSLFKRSRFVISHCATGVIIYAIQFKKPIVLFPRRAEYDEHWDDHQFETAKSIEGRKGIRVAYKEDELREAIRTFVQGSQAVQDFHTGEEPRIIETIKEFIKELERRK